MTQVELQGMQAAVVKAAETLKESVAERDARAEAVRQLEREVREAKVELARIDALPELTQSDLLAQENEKRRVRRLEGGLAQARAAYAEAEARADAADLAGRRAQFEVAKAKVMLQAEEITAFLLERTAPELLKLLDQHDAAIQQASDLHARVAVARGSHPLDAVAGPFSSGSPWARLDRSDLWAAVKSVTETLARQRRHAALLEGMVPARLAAQAHDRDAPPTGTRELEGGA